MNIRGYHRREISLMTMALVLFVVLDVVLIGSSSFHEGFRNVYGIIAYLIIFISHFIFLYLLFYELKIYYVNEDGIYVKWFGIIKIFCSWKNIKYISIDTVFYEGGGLRSAFYDYLICSKDKIQRKRRIQEEFNGHKVIKSAWLTRHPFKIIAIRISDFKEGQLEEFWSYVPDRLK